MQSALSNLEPIVLDWETYFDKDVSLKKLSYTDYVNHPDFFEFGASIWRLNSEPEPTFYNLAVIGDALDALDWDNTLLIAHNTVFDGYILHRRWNKHPARYSCTLSMARAILGGAIKLSLDNLGGTFGFGNKLGFLNVTRGKRILTPQEWDFVARGCNNDAKVCGELYKLFAPKLPQHEHELIHLTQRQFCRPLLRVNAALAQEALDEEVQEKDLLIAATGRTKKELSGDDSFAQILRDAGIDPPTKTSPRTGKEIYAFAKTDQAFQDLIEGEDPVAQKLCEARQAVQSTIGATRAQRLLNEANRGELPVCYLYFGAHTGRWSGGNKLNLQNLTRGSKLRLCIEAPEGYVLVVSDSSQIEVRTLLTLVGQEDGLAVFRDKRDPYIEMAEFIFKTKIELVLDENGELVPATAEGKLMRFIGKCVVLGCGYQMGPPKFQASLAIGAIGGKRYDITIEEAQEAVWGYRNKMDRVVLGWEEGNCLLSHMVHGVGVYHSWLQGISACADTKRILLPGGTWLSYPNLHYDTQERQFKYVTTRGERKIYGGKVIENITQGVARNIIGHQILEVDRIAPVVMDTHDEIVAMAPEQIAESVAVNIHDIMRTAPPWFPGIPLDAKGGYARNYSK